MSKLTLLRYPDPRLHKVARPVTVVDDRIRQLASDMLVLMYAAEGVGLAATQVDVHEQVVVIDISEERNEPLVFINPQLIAVSDVVNKGEEGCLSVPNIRESVPRFETVTVQALNLQGQRFECEAAGLLSVCIQHEMDHLMGRVFVERLSPLKRDRILSKFLKAQREAQRT
jgi:peptide deformylase